MYYPYFRGKQFDLLALKTLVLDGLLTDQITPIIEPVKNSATLKSTVAAFEKYRQPYFLIINPQAGDFLTAGGSQTLEMISDKRAFIFNSGITLPTNENDLLIVSNGNLLASDDFIKTATPTVVPLEFRLLKKIEAPLILSVDPFTRIRNSFYQEIPDELFTKDHLTYQERGFYGFSDFTIDSRIYYDQGYPSQTLVLHLIYPAEEGIRIRHFSSPELPEGDMKSRFLLLMEEIQRSISVYWPKGITEGLQLLLTAAKAGRFPGMGVMRKAMVMHHLEIMGRVLTHSS